MRPEIPEGSCQAAFLKSSINPMELNKRKDEHKKTVSGAGWNCSDMATPTSRISPAINGVPRLA